MSLDQKANLTTFAMRRLGNPIITRQDVGAGNPVIENVSVLCYVSHQVKHWRVRHFHMQASEPKRALATLIGSTACTPAVL